MANSKKRAADNDEHLRAARLRAVAEQPYLASAIWRLYYYQSEWVPTMGVTKNWSCCYNPEWFNKLPILEAATTIIHEVWHLLRDHASRAVAHRIDEHNKVAWNVCADCAINCQLGSPLKLPKGVCLPKDMDWPDNQTVEYYYDLLPEVKVKLPNIGNEGSGVTGQQEEWEPKDGQDNNAPKMSDLEKELIRRKVAEDIKHSRGTVPEGAKLWAEEFLRPKVNWRSVLSGLCKQSMAWQTGMVDYTFSKRSRRQGIFQDFVLPALRAPIPKICVVLDTSGSMECEKRLEQAVAEVSGVIKDLAAPADVICTDAEAYEQQQVFNVKNMQLVGGGGTDMGIGLQAAADKKHHTVVVITDGETPWPDRVPRPIQQVIVCLVAGDREGVPTWAKKVVVTDT